MTLRAGVDVGGTKIAVAVLDAANQCVFEQRRPTPVGDYSATIDTIVSMVKEAEQATARDQLSVGIGIPGSLSPTTGRVRNANSTCLNERDLPSDLQSALSRPLRFANDADCLALSESIDGAAVGANIAFAVILGTGVGGAIVVDGNVATGKNAIRGEWGHNPLPWPVPESEEVPGALCWCGRHGCIETWLSGPGLINDYGCDSGAVETAHTAQQVVAAANNGDARAIAAMHRYFDRLSRSLATVINLLDPDLIVVGGGLSKIEAIYREVPKRWGQWLFSDSIETTLVAARHGDASGVRGAARLWPLGER